MSELLRIATSSLLASQAALTTAGHNIANAGVDGYSRQRVDLGTRTPQFVGSGFIGRGVDVQTIERLVDDFVTRQLRADTWVFAAADTLRAQAEQIDGILADPSTGLGARIDGFFATFQAAADNPYWLPTREVVIEQTRTLAERFNAMYQRLADTNSAVNTQLRTLAADVDALARGIAELNLQITTAVGLAGGDHQPNDLLDQREQMLLELAERVDISTLRDGESINVFLGRGQTLVVGGIANRVQTVEGRYDPARDDIAVVVNGDPAIVTESLSGGRIGGLLAFRQRVLDPAFNEIGRVALGIAADVNAQHGLGMDLEGDLGGLVFSDINASLAQTLRARGAGDNDPASTGVVTVSIDDTSSLTTSSYRLDILAGGAWRLFRDADETVVASGAALTDPLVSVDGFTLNLDLPIGNFVAGDSFLIEPTRRGAADIAALISRAEDLAFAQPVRATAGTGNLGEGEAAIGAVFDTGVPLFQTTPRALSPPLLIRFTSATTFDVLDNSNPASPVALVPPLSGLAYSPGVANTLFSTVPTDPDYFGFQVTISGDPQLGDTFAIGYNTGGVSDNRNALALANLQTANRLAGGNASYQVAYGQLVADVGTETRRARIDTDAARTLVEQTRAAREEVSGVNLDEEAADLIRFQQSYNAAAQAIAIARSVIDTLLEATG